MQVAAGQLGLDPELQRDPETRVTSRKHVSQTGNMRHNPELVTVRFSNRAHWWGLHRQARGLQEKAKGASSGCPNMIIFWVVMSTLLTWEDRGRGIAACSLMNFKASW